ncbi:MAG: FAD-dependent thymidylate synthase, partial [Alphaproteobacteria bacterium]|nr:FAD-dependent thymidylate synthase [Alphaproteobacteria bacterium]
RHRHTTPFEMCEIKLHIKLPIFVARQWIRHRTANVNEYSARYSKMDREYYIPDPEHLQALLEERNRKRREREAWPDLFEPRQPEEPATLAAQSDMNRQGREGRLTAAEVHDSLSRLDWVSSRTYGVYRNLLNEDEDGEKIREDRSGIARELARSVLPVNYYTQFYWKCDLHNLLHFLSLRADSHAQYEIRAYADLILDEIVKRWVPVTYRAFQDYVHRAALLSAGALDVVRRMLAGERVEQPDSGLGAREWRELMAVLNREP